MNDTDIRPRCAIDLVDRTSSHRPSLLFRPGCWITGLTALPLLVGGLYFGVDWAGKRQLERAQARLAADGLDLDALTRLPPRPPDSENFAATPLLRGIAQGTVSGPAWEGAKRIGSWTSGSPGPSPRLRSPNDPAPTDWATVHEAARTAHPSAGLVQGDPNPVPALWNWVQSELDPATAELQSVLDRPAAILIPSELEQITRSSTPDASAPDYSALLRLAIAYRHRAALAVERKDGTALVDSIRLVLKLAQAARSESEMLGTMIGWAALRSAQEGMWNAAEARILSGEGWRSLGAHWRECRPLERFDDSLRRVIAISHLRHTRWWRHQPAEYLQWIGEVEPDSWQEQAAPLIPPGWVDAAHAAWLSEIQLLRHRIADTSILDRYNLDDWVASRVSDARFPSPDVGARDLLDGISNLHERVASYHAVARLAEAACALEAHFAEHQTYPVSLEHLVPEFLVSVPLDLDGQPVRYAPAAANGRYKLWSLGTNGVDDGGVAKPSGKFKSVWNGPSGDWVWQYPP
ncbi:MAG: hypothetical protein ACKV19_29840 [Verrucomicrobiales bacterium]